LTVGDVVVEQQAAEQQGHRSLQPGPEDKATLAAGQVEGQQAHADEDRAHDECERRTDQQSRCPYLDLSEASQVDGQAQRQEGHDLAQAGQRGVEPFDLALVGGSGVPEQKAGDEEPRKPESESTVAAPKITSAPVSVRSG